MGTDDIGREFDAAVVPSEVAGAALAALADPTRREVLRLLTAAGGASATALAREMPITRQAIVQHLAVLDAAGLVVPARRGREVRYGLRTAGVAAAGAWLAALTREWEAHPAAETAPESPGS